MDVEKRRAGRRGSLGRETGMREDDPRASHLADRLECVDTKASVGKESDDAAARNVAVAVLMVCRLRMRMSCN